MSDISGGGGSSTGGIQPHATTQAALGTVRSGVIRNDIQENVQPNVNGVIAPFSFQPPGGVSGWKRVRITNYTPYLFQVIGVPDGGTGDPPQLLQPFQSNVWNYVASRGTITLVASEPGSPLAIPPLRFAYGEGTAKDQLLFNFVTIEWTDTPELFFGYYPVPLTGIAINAEAQQVSAPVPTVIPVGTDPVALSVNPTTNRVYVANNGSNNVSVIDGNTNTVVATVAVGHPPIDLAVDTVHNRIYVAVTGSHLVVIIDGNSNIIVGSVDVGADQAGICVDSVTHKKYVSLVGGTDVAVLSALDVLLVGAGYPIVVGTAPSGLEANTTTAQVYVANTTDGTVSQIDEATDTVIGGPIAVGHGPTSVSVDSLSDLIWVANTPDDTISEINGATALVTHTIPVGDNPFGTSVNPVSGKVYTANNGANSDSVIDEPTHVVVATLSPGVGPNDVAVNPTTNLVYTAITANAVVVLMGV